MFSVGAETKSDVLDRFRGFALRAVPEVPGPEASVASGPRQAEMLAAAKSLHASQKGRLSRKARECGGN